MGCMGYPEKATLSGYIENYRLLILDHEEKKRLEKKTWNKTNLHHRMYELSRKSYIIMLSREFLNFQNQLWTQN